MDDESQTPKRPRKRSSKKSKPEIDSMDTPPVPKVGVVDPSNTNAIKSLIQSILTDNLEKNKARSEGVDICNALVSTISEFLSSFVVLGYDDEGEPVILSYASTSRDNDALRNLFLKFLPKFMQSQHVLEDPEDL